MTNHIPQAPHGEFVLFTSADGVTRVECRFESDTLWLSQATMAELYDKDVRTINEHLVNIYNEGELVQSATIRKFRIVRLEGSRRVNRQIDHYNLEAILAVGYRVRSNRGTQFRQWATQTLQEYLVKGFAMDDERLKNPPVAHSSVPDYFDEMLERIRDIRASAAFISELKIFLRWRRHLNSTLNPLIYFFFIFSEFHRNTTRYTQLLDVTRRFWTISYFIDYLGRYRMLLSVDSTSVSLPWC